MGTIINFALDALFAAAGAFAIWVLVTETRKTITMLRGKHDAD